MKIGILTFHWATNYGAILQAFCLQDYLCGLGHEVYIINYKPCQYEFSWIKYIKHPRRLHVLKRDLNNRRKELLLTSFRSQYLKQTRRYFCIADFENDAKQFDALISGSDQVLNPGFTMFGEDGFPSSAYWLGFGSGKMIRLGYAVSFGYEYYPEDAVSLAKQWVNEFNAIGVREKTGLCILQQLDYKGRREILPDPTLLLGEKIFSRLNIEVPLKKDIYTCVYMLRHEIYLESDNIKYIDEKHHPLTMEQWMTTIVYAKQLITNSYHGMIMAIFAQVPFVVLLENHSASGMNDRFYTLLGQIGMRNRLASNVSEALKILEQPIDFDKLVANMMDYSKVGKEFLTANLN